MCNTSRQAKLAKQCNHTQESFKPACKSYFIRLTASVFWIFILCRVCGICTISPLGDCRKIFQQRVMFISINRRASCNLHSNAKGRLKHPSAEFFRRPFISGIDYLINQARHPLFSLYSAYWVPKRFCRPLCRWRSYLCPDSPDGAGSSGCS